MFKRVITYIDGFNLYFGLKEKGWKRYYWLNLQKLAESLLKPDQELIEIKYFTARISSWDKNTPDHLKSIKEAKFKRQTVFLDALATLNKLTIFEGQYLSKTIRCDKCGNEWDSPEEKMTDVNIASQLLADAIDDKFDMAMIVSGDSDLVPAIRILKEKFPKKRVVSAFPPARVSKYMKKVSDAYFTIGEPNIRASVFPDKVVRSDGYVLQKPKKWH